VLHEVLAVESTDKPEKLRTEITSSKVHAQTFRKFADSIDDIRAIGTAFNEIGATESECYSVGSLLGRGQEVAKLRPDEEVDLKTRTPENAASLRVSAQALDNFVIAADNALGMTANQLAQTWNLDCVGRLGIARTSREKMDRSITFEPHDAVLRVMGDVEAGFADQLIAAIRSNPTTKTVALGGSGDSLTDAIRAGTFLREHHLNTTLWNSCYATCPLVFMGGVERTIWSPYPVVGFHQVVGSDGNPVKKDSEAYTSIVQYAKAMGIDSQLIIHAMQDSPPSSMTVIEGHEDVLCDTRFATWIQRGCSAN